MKNILFLAVSARSARVTLALHLIIAWATCITKGDKKHLPKDYTVPLMVSRISRENCMLEKHVRIQSSSDRGNNRRCLV